MNEFGTYYDYEVALTHGVLLPFLQKMGKAPTGKRILDVGCGERGLAGLAEFLDLVGSMAPLLDPFCESVEILLGKHTHKDG